MRANSSNDTNVKQADAPFSINPETFLHEKNIKSAMSKAASDVDKAQQAFNETQAKISKILDERAAFLKGNAAYIGLFDDYISYGIHSTQEIPLQDGDINNILDMITEITGIDPRDEKNKKDAKNAENTKAGKNTKDIKDVKNHESMEASIVAEINARIDENITRLPKGGGDFYIDNLTDPFLPPFATFPKKTKEDVEHGMVTSNTNLKAIIAREAFFHVLLKRSQRKYQSTMGTSQKAAEGHLNSLEGKLKTLQDTMVVYNKLNPSFPIVIPGIISATAGEFAYEAVLSKVQIASANRINAVNSAEANVLLREIAQQLSQNLTNVANTLKKDTDTAVIDLRGIMSKESLRLLDNYRLAKGGTTMADKYGALIGTVTGHSKFTITLGNINKHIGGLSTMIKRLSDEGSKKIIDVQGATYNSNTANENLSKIIRKIFSAMDAAFGLQE